MSLSRHFLLAITFCVTACSKSHGQVRLLEPRDFVIAGIAEQYPYIDVEADSASIRQVLGRPDSIRRHEFQPGDTITAWHYEGLVVEFGSIARIGISLTSARVPTARGLRVGDTERRLLALYGPPSRREDSEWIYEDPRERLNAISITVRSGRIERIFIGSIWD